MKLSKEKVTDIFLEINAVFVNMILQVKPSITEFMEKELFDDFVESYNRAFRMISNNKMLDGMVILRNSFELMLMLFGVRIDSIVREEYCREDSYKRYLKRKDKDDKAIDYLSPAYLRDLIHKKYPNIDANYSQLYGALSKYAHPTFYRNIMRFYEREKIDVIVSNLNLANMIPTLFLEVLYEQGLVLKGRFDDVLMLRFIIDRLSTLYLVYMDKSDILKANKYVFSEINQDFNRKQIEKMKNDFLNTEKIVKDYNQELKESLNKLLSKVEYYNLAKKLSGLGF